MKITVAMFLGLLAMPSVLAQDTTPRDRVLATVQTFIRANETANLELILGTFDDNATVFLPNTQPQRANGKAEIREAFAQAFKPRTGPITITPRNLDVQLFDDFAVVTAHLRDLPAAPILEPITFARRTFVLRQIGGRWLIVHLHASGYLLSPAPN
jgi:ketosteroid isomerase-like protein